MGGGDQSRNDEMRTCVILHARTVNVLERDGVTRGPFLAETIIVPELGPS